MSQKNVDFIIVGQGLAGTLIGHKLSEANYTLCIIDQPKLSQASKVAAGIWNPVVFKRLTKSWMVDDLLPTMLSTYERISVKMRVKRFAHPIKYLKIISGENERKFWEKKSKIEMKDFLSTELSSYPLKNSIQTGEVYQTGFLEIERFLAESESYFSKTQLVIQEDFDYDQIRLEKDFIQYKNIKSKKIIFCEGFKCLKNPYFKFLQFKPVKGEILTIKSESLLPESILNKGVFILPLPEKNLYKVGATYDWNNLNDEASAEGEKVLTDSLKEILDEPFEIVKHQAGVRPSVIDRRPILGSHPENDKIWIFNGLGTKGVMLGPFFAEMLSKAILNLETVDPIVDPIRFFKKS